MSGLTSTGFEIPSLDDIAQDIAADILASVDPSLDLSAESPLGQILMVFARQLRLNWEAILATYGAVDPNKAEGINLDNVCALSGVTRKPATYSQVEVTLDLDASTTVPAGSIMAVDGAAASQFELLEDVASTTAGTYYGIAQALTSGPVVANAGTLTQIVTVVSGWNTVTNALDADLGTNVETDANLRVRREEELTLAGSSSTDAIRADVLAVDGVEQCNVYENVTLTTDADGVPGKAFEVVLWDGDVPAADNEEITEAIWGSKPAGIQAFGVTTVSHTDESGNTINIGFTRSTKRRVYLDITVTTNSDFDAVNGPAAIKQLIADKGNTLRQGEDVVALVLRAAALDQPGVVDAPVFELGFAASPSGTANLTISTREIARFSTGDITVTVV